MEYQYFTMGYVIGMAVGLVGFFYLFGSKEGNRQDYVMKIGLLQKRVHELEKKCERLEDYLNISEEQCKDRMNKIYELSREVQEERDKNHEMQKEMVQIRSGLKMYRKATSV